MYSSMDSREDILYIVRRCTCQVCHAYSPFAIVLYPMMVLCMHVNKTRTQPPTDEERLEVWNTVWVNPPTGGWRTPEMCLAFHRIYTTMNRVEYGSVPTMTLMQRMLSTKYITPDEWENIAGDITHVNASDIFLRVNKLENAREIEEQWHMNSIIFDKYIQWLPREMVEDVTELLAIAC